MRGNTLQMQAANNRPSTNCFDFSGILRNFLRAPSSEVDLEAIPLREGDRGPSVRQLQIRLAAFNLYQGEISGYLDSATKHALEEFQRIHELEESGSFGTETWYAMTFWSQER